MPNQTAAPIPPEIVSAILRDPDSPHYPTEITVYCDRYGCTAEHTGDYMVSEGMSSEERLAVARQHLVEAEGWEHTADGDDFCPGHVSTSAVEQPAPVARTFTPDREHVNDEGRTVTTIKVKRCCNGCGQYLGDADNRDVDDNGNLTDVRGECAHCRPLVELEAAGCTTWHLTPRSYSNIDRQLDRDGVFTKQFTEMADGHVVTVGMRVGVKPGHVVARFGDWLIRHPDGTFTVHAAPAAVETGE